MDIHFKYSYIIKLYTYSFIIKKNLMTGLSDQNHDVACQARGQLVPVFYSANGSKFQSDFKISHRVPQGSVVGPQCFVFAPVLFTH